MPNAQVSMAEVRTHTHTHTHTHTYTHTHTQVASPVNSFKHWVLYIVLICWDTAPFKWVGPNSQDLLSACFKSLPLSKPHYSTVDRLGWCTWRNKSLCYQYYSQGGVATMRSRARMLAGFTWKIAYSMTQWDCHYQIVCRHDLKSQQFVAASYVSSKPLAPNDILMFLLKRTHGFD